MSYNYNLENYGQGLSAFASIITPVQMCTAKGMFGSDWDTRAAEYIKTGAHVNESYEFDGKTEYLIMGLIRLGLHNAIDAILEHKELNINVQDSDGNTPLIYLCRYSRRYHLYEDDYLDKFLKHGADPTIENNKGKTALDYAVSIESIHCLEKYMFKKIKNKINGVSANFKKLLKSAILSENVKLIKKLHESRVDFNNNDLLRVPEDIYIPNFYDPRCSASFAAAVLNKPQALNAMIECNGLDPVVKSLADQGYPFEPEILPIIYKAAYLEQKQPSKLAKFKVPMSFTADKIKMSAQKGRGE